MRDDWGLFAVSVIGGFLIADLLNSTIQHHAALAPNQPNCLAGDPHCKQDPNQPSPNAAPIPAAKPKTPKATPACTNVCTGACVNGKCTDAGCNKTVKCAPSTTATPTDT